MKKTKFWPLGGKKEEDPETREEQELQENQELQEQQEQQELQELQEEQEQQEEQENQENQEEQENQENQEGQEQQEKESDPKDPKDPNNDPDSESARIEALLKEIDELKKQIITARAEGELAGRNARIEELLETDRGDGLPGMAPSTVNSAGVDSIFSLAAGAR